MTKIADALACLFLVSMPVEAMAKTDACMTREEARALALFILPDAVASLREKCDATLPVDAYLKTSGASERFRTDRDKNWPLARLAFAKMGGGGAAFDLIGEKATRALITGAITAGITRDVKPKACGGADRMLAALAPLPTANIGMLLDSFFLLGLGNAADKSGGFKICPDPLAALPAVGK